MPSTWEVLPVGHPGWPPDSCHRVQAHLPANTEAFADPRLDLIIDDCKVQLEQATEPWLRRVAVAVGPLGSQLLQDAASRGHNKNILQKRRHQQQSAPSN